MAAGNSEVSTHLAAFLTFNEAATKAFPELLGISERAVLLAALAHADADGFIGYGAWAEHSGISPAYS